MNRAFNNKIDHLGQDSFYFLHGQKEFQNGLVDLQSIDSFLLKVHQSVIHVKKVVKKAYSCFCQKSSGGDVTDEDKGINSA